MSVPKKQSSKFVDLIQDDTSFEMKVQHPNNMQRDSDQESAMELPDSHPHSDSEDGIGMAKRVDNEYFRAQ